MNFFRTHRSAIAWMLYAFILFNGLACAMSHGQMMGTFSAKPAAANAHHDHQGASSMSGAHHEMSIEMPMDHAGKNMAMPGSLQSLFGDCSFAGTLTLAMIFFVVLSWLIRTRTPRFIFPSLWSGLASRQCFPGLSPQAP